MQRRAALAVRYFLADTSASEMNVEDAAESVARSPDAATVCDDLVNQSWTEDLELGEGPSKQLDSKETIFFQVKLDQWRCK